MTITYTIPGARTLNQLDEVTFDGQPDENANDNCVATSIAEALNILVGGGSVKFPKFVGDELKDAVYGQGYVGVQSAAHYISYCGDHGVILAAHSASQAGLIGAIHDAVAAGHPVVVTMPSQWSSAPIDPVHPAGSTHVGLAVGVGPGEIRVMNPWHGFMQDASDDWWQARLCYGQVWIMQDAQKVSDTVTTGQPTGFYGLETTDNAEVWHCPSTGQDVALGYRWFYAGLRGPGEQSATQLLGLPISGQYGVDGSKVRQDYERGAIIYDKSQPSAWQFYYAPIGQELQAARAQVKQTSDALAVAKQQAALDEGIIADQKQQIDKLTAQVTQLAAAQSSQAAQTPPPAPAPSPSPEEIARAAAHIFGEVFASALAAALASPATVSTLVTPAAAVSGAPSAR